MPAQILVDTLPGAAISYRLTDLAASADAFLRVEADVPGETVGTNIHARTDGGQISGTDQREVEIDTPLRSVHAYAPDMLMLVLADFNILGHDGANNDGPIGRIRTGISLVPMARESA